MHDTTYFETQGRPSVFVASSTFADAASTQAEALGLPDVKRVFVPHPIQDATDEEMVEKADEVIDELVAALTDS